MRGPVPLSDDDFAAVRAAVLSRIAQRRRAPWGELAALAASAIVAVVSFVAARRTIVVPRSAPHVVVSVARRPPTPILPPRFARGQDDKPHRKHHKAAPTQLARIEIHTADPDVRIIWINHQEAP